MARHARPSGPISMALRRYFVDKTGGEAYSICRHKACGEMSELVYGARLEIV